MKSNDESKKFVVDYIGAISGFSNVMQKFPVKNILYRNIFRGRGVEFDSYRNFESDDDASLIDWMASLRAQSLIARKYIEERDLNIYFLIDASNSMLFGSQDKLKAEYSAEFVLALSYLILESGDKVGLLIYNNEVIKYVPPAHGKKHFFMLVNTLSNPENYGGQFSIQKPFEFLLNTIKTDYNIFILVSDFINFKSSSEKILHMMSYLHETIAIMIRDPFDNQLPDSGHQLMISDPYSDRQILVDPDLARDAYEKNVLKQKKRLKEIFLKSNIDLLELNTKKDFYLPLSYFLRSRQRGVRV